MTIIRAVVLGLLAGCIVHADGIGGLGDGSSEAIDLYVDPSTVSDDYEAITIIENGTNHLDLRNVWDVRSLGDFDVLEWSSNRDSVMVVVQLHDEAEGEQPLAIDMPQTTFFATFDAY